MPFINIVLIAFALSMDAFSLAVSQGISKQYDSKNNLLKISLTFGFFQFFMTFLGYLGGNLFVEKIVAYGNYISFSIFLLLGILMFREGFKNEDDEKLEDSLDFKTLLLMGIATSIDALLVGLTFSFYNTFNVFTYSLEIGIITFFISMIGFLLGNKFGNIFGNKSHFVGGSILFIVAISLFF